VAEAKLAMAFAANRELVELYLSFNRVGVEDAERAKAYLSQHCVSGAVWACSTTRTHITPRE